MFLPKLRKGKGKGKRAVAFLLAVTLGTAPVVSYVQNARVIAQAVEDYQEEFTPTGLKLYWGEIPDTTGTKFSWPRKCYFEGGNGEWKDMAGRYVYCIANHTEQPSMGSEAYVITRLTAKNYKHFAALKRREGEISDDMKKFFLCLGSAAAIAPGKFSLSDCKDMYSTTEYDIMAQSVFLAIEGRMSTTSTIKSMDYDAALENYHKAMYWEYYTEPRFHVASGQTRQLDHSILSKVLAKRDDFFKNVWEAAIVMYNAFEGIGSSAEANTMGDKAAYDPVTGKLTLTVPCYGLKSVWDKYYSKTYITEGPAWNITERSYDDATSTGTIVFQGPAGVDLDKNPVYFKFPDSKYLTDLSSPLLYQFDFVNAENPRGGFQTMFCALQKDPTIRINHTSGFSSGSDPDEPASGGGEGTVTLEIHRYKHSENWKSTYNVDLIKYDSETGKPLKGSKWDILEFDTLGSWEDSGTQLGDTYLDHPSEEAESIGTKYNWANDEGGQFVRWEDGEEDPCDRDSNVNGADGYLYECNTVGEQSSTKAHEDVYDYTYTKGYCTGHPEPIIEYYEEIPNPDDDPEIDEENEKIAEKNAELDAMAEEAWQQQVDYCEQLAAEGGFFHTMDPGDSAKQELEADRDEFYNDFISLTYEYSAEEISARNGYILHGKHPDDIPIERVVIHSSEYLSGDASGVSVSEEEMLSDISLTDAGKKAEQETKKEARIRTEMDEPEEEAGKAYKASKTKEQNIQRKATASEMEDPEEEILDEDEFYDEEEEEEDDEDATPSGAAHKHSKATASDAVTDEVEQERKTVFDVLKRSFVTLFGLREQRSGARQDSVFPSTSGVIYVGPMSMETADISSHTQGDSEIEGWTFLAYDHRTEGEIHFNKRDLDLSDDGSETFDPYAQENADGTLEGAVYGLFALTDIVHPDSENKSAGSTDSGIVYKAGDLVAVASTDQDGNGSFMTFTEAPGSTYDYESGSIVKRTGKDAWNGPSNLHTEQSKAEAAVKDNEKFSGYDEEGSEVTLTDTSAGCENHMENHYHKHSSNQGLNQGEGCGSGTTYPISDNEGNNGNCWIGRPLIVSGKNAATYYIKELSRSEGYELSVYGKDMSITNREAFLNGGEVTAEGNVHTEAMDLTQKWDGKKIVSVNDLKVTGTDTTDGFDITLKDITKQEDTAGFYLVTSNLVEKEQESTRLVEKEVPVIGKKNQIVLIGGKAVEGAVGDTVELPNGTQATIHHIVTVSGDRLYEPRKPINRTLPTADTYNNAAGTDFISKYNQALRSLQFGTPENNAPWILVPVGATEQDSFNNITSALSGYSVFNRLKIVAEVGNNYVVQYSISGDNNCIYDMENQYVYVKKDVVMDGADGYIYARYDAGSLEHNTEGFIINDQDPSKTRISRYEDLGAITFTDQPEKSYWAYDGTENAYEDNGDLSVKTVIEEETFKETVTVLEEKETKIEKDHVIWDKDTNSYTLKFDHAGDFQIRIYYEKDTDETPAASYAKENGIVSSYIAPKMTGTYIEDVRMDYPGQKTLIQDAGTIKTPIQVYERPIRQKVRIEKTLNMLKEPIVAWYCFNCGYANDDSEEFCGFCEKAREEEVTKTIRYEDDTYSMASDDDLTAEHDPRFSFKIYLQSNLERLYVDDKGGIVWMDRYGNPLIPVYQDTDGDGNYETVKWKHEDGTITDFPERDKEENGSLTSANVQKIYTEVTHEAGSRTVSAIANNSWAEYTEAMEKSSVNAGVKRPYSTSLRPDTGNEYEGIAVYTSDSLYQYCGKNIDAAKSDRINDTDDQAMLYHRLLETVEETVTDGEEEHYEYYDNYEKFFDAIATANTDVWDDDMHTTFNGTGMKNYPGQHWHKTFYEKFQKDDCDRRGFYENTDGKDKDGTAGGDRDTSFRPFAWIREHMFGTGDDYRKYPAEHNGENTETESLISEYAKANAEASDAVRSFAAKWYLKDEVAKLVKDNGFGENTSIEETITYSDEIHDRAMLEAIEKSYRYLRPFYTYDLDTIYSVEWDSDPDGGHDKDYTTLAVTVDKEKGIADAVSAYLPYGRYVVVEQQASRMDGLTDEVWVSRAFGTELPQIITVPTVYKDQKEGTKDPHYNYDAGETPENQAADYLIRFCEEWPEGTTDARPYVIRAHNASGDFEVYKYGLDTDLIDGKQPLVYPGGSCSYSGWIYEQEPFHPLKDYYEKTHNASRMRAGMSRENDSWHYIWFREPACMAGEVTDGKETANGSRYDTKALTDRYFYASVSEDRGYSEGMEQTVADGNTVLVDLVSCMTGELTATDGEMRRHMRSTQTDPPTIRMEISLREWRAWRRDNENRKQRTEEVSEKTIRDKTGRSFSMRPCAARPDAGVISKSIIWTWYVNLS